MDKRIGSTGLLIATLLILAACQPYNPNREREQGQGARASARWLKLTALSDFYGAYELLAPPMSQADTVKLKERAAELNCQSPTRIGNANLSRFVRDEEGVVRLEQVILDSFDPNTRGQIPTDEIWFATGPDSVDGDCTDVAVPLFADRGTWTKLPDNGIQYAFDGELLKKTDSGAFTPDHVLVNLTVKPIAQRTEIAIRYERKSELATLNRTWNFKRLTYESSAGSVHDGSDGADDDADDDDEEAVRPPQPETKPAPPRSPVPAPKNPTPTQQRSRTERRKRNDGKQEKKGRRGLSGSTRTPY